MSIICRACGVSNRRQVPLRNSPHGYKVCPQCSKRIRKVANAARTDWRLAREAEEGSKQ